MAISAINVAQKQYVKAQEPKGHLVNSSIIRGPKTILSDIKYDMKALKDGFTGKANDHQLGKLNDLGMKAGGLAIAAYIATQKTTPKTKLMEFVGLGTFLAAMKLWPKIAISLPAKAIHGFDPNQEYVDSQGRKKPFFQDPQYTPWDLYSDKELEKIGDSMGVAKDANDRNDLTKSNMKKIAVKNNTLWMLTAGLASAVFSALACNKAEKAIDPALEKVNNQKADKLLQNFDAEAKKRSVKTDNAMKKDLNAIYTENKDKAIDDKLLEKITKRLTKGLDPVTSEGIEKDVKAMLINGNSKVDSTLVENIVSGSKTALAKRFTEEQIEKIVPSAEDLTKHFEKNNFMNKEVSEDEAMKVRVSVSQLVMSNAKAQGLGVEKLKVIKKEVVGVTANAIKSNTASVLNENTMKKVSKFGKVMSDLQAKASILDDYAQIKVADKPETIIANYWNDVASSTVKILGIDFKEMEKVRNNRELVQDLLRNKIEEITSDDEKYKTVVTKLATKIAELDKKIKPEDTKKYLELVTKTYDDVATVMYNNGWQESSDKMTAYAVNGKGSLKRVKQTYFTERIDGVRNSFSRLLSTLDVYRRISKGNVPNNGMSREANEALLELAKQTTLQGHSSDHSIKFYFNRDQNISQDVDKSPVEIKNGKVVNKYYKQGQGVDIPGDYDFYQKAMNFMYNSEMDKDTIDALRKAGIENQVKTYNNEVFTKIGGADYFTKPDHKTCGDQGASSEYKFLLLGVAPDEMMTKTVQQSYNSEKWGKTFGTVGALLTGITVLSQFLFGKGKAVK